MQTRTQTFSRILRARGARADQPGLRAHSHHSVAFMAQAFAPGSLR